MEKMFEEITICRLQVLLMPNGELICNGKTIGWFETFKKFLEVDNETIYELLRESYELMEKLNEKLNGPMAIPTPLMQKIEQALDNKES